MNAFQTVRPSGADTAPSKAPRKTNTSKAHVGVPMARDRNGRPTVSLEPRRVGAITIENWEQSAASLAKRQRISKAGA